MKKNLLSIGITVFILSMFSPVFAADWYVGAKVGASFMEGNKAKFDDGTSIPMDFDWGSRFAILGGASLEKLPMRFELSLYQESNDIDSITDAGVDYSGNGDFKTQGIMGRIAFEYRNKTAFTPALIVGVGYSRSTLEFNIPMGGGSWSADETNYSFSGHLGAELTYKFSENIYLTTEYICSLEEDKINTVDGDGDRFYLDDKLTHGISFGIRWYLNLF